MTNIPLNEHQPRNRCSICYAFTLLELVLVIAIIAVLAALLLPVLGKSKAKAEGMTCASNLRQLSLAWFLYADDNGELLPGPIT